MYTKAHIFTVDFRVKVRLAPLTDFHIYMYKHIHKLHLWNPLYCPVSVVLHVK